MPVRSEIVVADLAADEGVARVRQTIEGSADLELLVNNAGFGSLKRFWEADWRMRRIDTPVYAFRIYFIG